MNIGTNRRSVFSFVFGDGDPNEKILSETRWQLIAEAIAKRGGSVVAEQLAPYLDPPKDAASLRPEEAQRALDKAMLPALLRFRGKPEVATDGTIVYVFPELQESRAAGDLIVGDLTTQEMKSRLSAMGSRSSAVERPDIVADYRRALDLRRGQSSSSSFSYLPEKEVKFTEADEGQQFACAALGVFVLLATLFFGFNIITGK
ncbi:unnamed protein product, partial [Polarella glacialis]